MSTDSRSPREKRSSTNDPEAFSKGSPDLGMETPSKQGGDANAGVEWENSKANAPYVDGGGIYSRPRKS